MLIFKSVTKTLLYSTQHGVEESEEAKNVTNTDTLKNEDWGSEREIARVIQYIVDNGEIESYLNK